MDKNTFNNYCAEVMGWVSCTCSASIGKDLSNQQRFKGEAWSTATNLSGWWLYKAF